MAPPAGTWGSQGHWEVLFSVVATRVFFSKLAVCPAQPVPVCLPQSLLLPDNQHRAGSGCSLSRLTLGIAEACSWSAIKEKLKSFLPVFQNSPEGQMFPSAPVRNSIQIHFWENLRVLSPFSIGLELAFCFLPCTAPTGNKWKEPAGLKCQSWLCFPVFLPCLRFSASHSPSVAPQTRHVGAAAGGALDVGINRSGGDGGLLDSSSRC